jgi:hypothetical protein
VTLSVALLFPPGIWDAVFVPPSGGMLLWEDGAAFRLESNDGNLFLE